MQALQTNKQTNKQNAREYITLISSHEFLSQSLFVRVWEKQIPWKQITKKEEIFYNAVGYG
jgi:hypothetical protein